MLFQQIRSAAIKLNFGNIVFLIDPWLRDSSSSEEVLQAKRSGQFISTPVTPLPMSAQEVLQDVSYVLVSHMHSDHFTPDHLPKDIPLIFQNEADRDEAKEMGFTNISCFSEDTLQFQSITVTKVGGLHGDTPKLAERLGPVSGFVFESENEKTIYVAGDTVFCEEVKKTIDRFHPEVVVVNACDAGGPDGRLIMNKEDVTELCRYASNSLVIASHMDAVSHARLTRTQLKAYLTGTDFEKQVLIPEDGEMIKL